MPPILNQLPQQVSPSRRIVFATSCLAVLSLLLTLSTFIHLAPGVFFAFVISNGIAQAGSGSYLQTSVIAVASVFGPAAVQAVMSGQAAVAVVVSGVQVLSAITSLWGIPEKEIATYRSDGKAEERSAFLFFGLSTLFLLFTIGVHQWLVTTQAYKTVVRPTRMQGVVQLDEGSFDETQRLVSMGGRSSILDDKAQILRVAKANVKYEFAVAYVFIVTLV
jgi:solute carrier family 29 (equilibrative nucleoside transporter), member 1/2/3